LAVRLLIAAAVAAVPAARAAASCGTGAVGVAACRTIEDARCDAAPVCSPGFDVNDCVLFYHDDCLNGLGYGNDDAGDDEKGYSTLATKCVAAINACAGEPQLHAPVEGGCGAYGLQPGVTCGDAGLTAITPCDIILQCPEVLADCNFVAATDAGSDAETDADAAETGTGGTGGSGG
jgi:hypothetical protein